MKVNYTGKLTDLRTVNLMIQILLINLINILSMKIQILNHKKTSKLIFLVNNK